MTPDQSIPTKTNSLFATSHVPPAPKMAQLQTRVVHGALARSPNYTKDKNLVPAMPPEPRSATRNHQCPTPHLEKTSSRCLGLHPLSEQFRLPRCSDCPHCLEINDTQQAQMPMSDADAASRSDAPARPVSGVVGANATNPAVQEPLSKVALYYRTNEWAKHLEAAEAPTLE